MRVYIAALSAAVLTGSGFVFASSFFKKRSIAQIETYLASHSISHKGPVLSEGTIFNPRYIISHPTISFRNSGEETLASTNILLITKSPRNGYEISSSNDIQLTLLPLGPQKSDFIPQTYSFYHQDRPAFRCRFVGKFDFNEETLLNRAPHQNTEFDCSVPAHTKLIFNANKIKLAESISPVHFSFAFSPSPDLKKGRISANSDLNIRFFSPTPGLRPIGGLSEEIFSLADDLKGDQRFMLKASYTGSFTDPLVGDPFSFAFAATTSSPTAEMAAQWHVGSSRHADNKIAVKLSSDVSFTAKPDFKLTAQKHLGLLDSGESPPFNPNSSPLLSHFIHSLPDKERMIPEFMNLIPDFYALGPVKHSLSADFILSAPLTSSPYQLSSIKISKLNVEVGKRTILGSGFIHLSTIPEGNFNVECNPCESTLKEILNYASEVERFSSHLSSESASAPSLSADRQSDFISISSDIAEHRDKKWIFHGALNKGEVTLGSYPLDTIMSKLSDHSSQQ